LDLTFLEVTVQSRPNRSRCCSMDKKQYTINDLGPNSGRTQVLGKTRRVPWSQLKRHVDGKRLVSGVLEWLAELLPNSNVCEKRLQCNINKYSASDRMSLHRDDRDEAMSTFDQAAVTCLLYAQGMTLTAQERAGFDLYGNPAALDEPLDCYPNTLSDEEYRELCCKFWNDYEYRAGVLIGVTGNAYKFGLHGARTGWRPKSNRKALSFERISLNFRLVKDDAWDKLLSESKKPAH
jgi:hypothetical protein